MRKQVSEDIRHIRITQKSKHQENVSEKVIDSVLDEVEGRILVNDFNNLKLVNSHKFGNEFAWQYELAEQLKAGVKYEM